MRTSHTFRRVLSAGLAWWLGSGLFAAEPASDRLLTDAEVRALERENQLWRLVKPEEEVAANLDRMRKAGASEREIGALELRLTGMWTVAFERNFGWLREDTIERIKEIDRQFITKMRATRLHAATGIQPGGQLPASVPSIERSWRRAILRALDYDEIAEFRLMNSTLARDEMQRAEGLTLTEDERRTLFVWRREFEGRRIGSSAPGAVLSAWQQREILDEWRRIRDLLGDERFATYLAQAQASFGRMREALARSGEPRPTPTLDLWWLRQGYDLMRSDRDPGVRNGNELKAEVRAKALALLGEEPLERYLAEEDGRWLVPQVVRRVNVPGIGAAISNKRPTNGTFTVPKEKETP